MTQKKMLVLIDVVSYKRDSGAILGIMGVFHMNVFKEQLKITFEVQF